MLPSGPAPRSGSTAQRLQDAPGIPYPVKYIRFDLAQLLRHGRASFRLAAQAPRHAHNIRPKGWPGRAGCVGPQRRARRATFTILGNQSSGKAELPSNAKERSAAPERNSRSCPQPPASAAFAVSRTRPRELNSLQWTHSSRQQPSASDLIEEKPEHDQPRGNSKQPCNQITHITPVRGLDLRRSGTVTSPQGRKQAASSPSGSRVRKMAR